MTVVPFRDQHKMQQENSWLPMVGLFSASATITILAVIGAIDLVRSIL